MDQNSNSAYQEAFENSLDAIVCSNETGLITLWNPAAEQMFGYSSNETLGQPITMLMSAADQNKHKAGFEHIISTGEARISGSTVEVSALRKDGSSLSVELSLSSTETEHGWSFTAILRDIAERKHAEELMRDSAAKLADAQRIGHMGNWEFDVISNNGRFSDETYRIFGVAKDYSRSFKSFFKLVHPDDRLLVKQANQKAIDSGSFSNVQYRIVRPGGSVRFVQTNGEAQKDESGELCRLFGSIQDITERKQVEKELADLHIRVEAMAETVSDVLYMIDTDARVIWWNKHVEYITGLSPEEIQNSPAADFFHRDDWPRLQQAIELAFATGEAEEELQYLTINGPVLYHFKGTVVRNEQGIVIGLTGIGRDISERKKVEAMLLESENRLQGIIEGNPVPTIITRMSDGLVRYANQPVAELFRVIDDEVIGKQTPNYFVHPEDRDSIMQELARAGKTQLHEIHLCRPDGTLFWALVTLSAIDFEHEPSVMASLYDITERKQAEAALKESEEKYRLLINNQTDMVVKVDTEGKFQFVSPSYCEMFGMTEKDLLGKEFMPLVHEEDREPVAKAMKALYREPYTAHIEQRAMTKDGWKWLSWMDTSVLDEENNVIAIIGVGRDITERKQAEELLRKLSSAVEQAGESIVITDREGVIEYVNPAFSQLTGYPAEEVIGQTPRMFKSGNQDADFYEDMWKTISSGKVWHGKVIDRKKDGSFYPAMLTISPVFDQPGEGTAFSHFVGIQSDLTKLEDMEHQFHQAQKMEAIGTLVGGIAHDFNNMLAGITGNLYLAKQRTREMPAVVRNLDNIENIAFRASDMIQQLLTFARKDMVSIKLLPLNAFIKGTLALLCASVPENIDMHQDICSESLQIKGDSTQLHQVLLNLINNARDAVEGVDNPCINIGMESFNPDEVFIDRHPYVKNKPYAHLSVEDNGCGISAHQIEHLFEPFFTTKEQGKGTGLGLSMVFGAVKTHHGFLEVDSHKGRGSVFHIYLPLVEEEESIAVPSQQKEVARGQGELILLVDDDQHIIKTGKEVLEVLGYQVLMATNGQQAVEIFETHSEQIDLIIMDIVMPVMGGDKAAQYIRRIDPHVKVIFATGYDQNLQTEMANEAVLSKPFSIVKMSHLIREQLAS